MAKTIGLIGKKLNLGGGRWQLEGWDNLDIKYGYDILEYKLSPFPNNSVELIYTSHNIEHFPWSFIPTYLSEAYRVLQPGGTIRMVVPDTDLMWAMLRDNNDEPLFHNPYYKMPGKSNRPLLVNVRQLFGFVEDMNSDQFLDNTMHLSFFNESTLGILLANAGFKRILKKAGPNDSIVKDFAMPAVIDENNVFVSGFDNLNAAPISLYMEATK